MKTISTKGFEAVVRQHLTGVFVMRESITAGMEANGGAIVHIIADIWLAWALFAHSGRGAAAGCLLFNRTAAVRMVCPGVRVNQSLPRFASQRV